MAEIDPLAFQRGFQSSQSIFDQQRQNKLQDLLMGQKMRAIEQENALASIIGNQQNYDTAGNLKREALPQIAQASPSQYGAFRQQIAQQDSAAQAAQKAKREDLMGWIKFSQERMANVNSPESWTAFKQEASQVYPEYAGRLPDQYDPAQIANAQRNAVPFLEQLKLNQQQAQFNANQQNAAANREVTMRGQDMNDKRARDLNETRAEEARIKREQKDDAASLTKASQIASFDTMLGTLDRLSKHPGLQRSVGLVGALPTMPGSDSANFQAELNTFQSQAFLPMVAQLKGMGALSDAEGKKLTAAVGALDPKMGEQAFRASIQRIIADMQSARNRMTGGAAGSGAQKQVVRTGTFNGRKVVQYSDGSVEYQ